MIIQLREKTFDIAMTKKELKGKVLHAGTSRSVPAVSVVPAVHAGNEITSKEGKTLDYLLIFDYGET